MKNNAFIYLLGILVIAGLGGAFLYYTTIKPQQIKADCYKAVYSTIRKNENNFEWAEGKKWMPKPGNQVTDSESYVWIYPDQSDTTQEGLDAARARSQEKEYQYTSCMHSQGY